MACVLISIIISYQEGHKKGVELDYHSFGPEIAYIYDKSSPRKSAGIH